mmetsp:Transcript_40243/g.110675  ORF Transcript_40243/g.110675 Transcript_40243/m.110675 type:complete len:220 (+) Transcript_40243:443-1102(+)
MASCSSDLQTSRTSTSRTLGHWTCSTRLCCSFEENRSCSAWIRWRLRSVTFLRGIVLRSSSASRTWSAMSAKLPGRTWRTLGTRRPRPPSSSPRSRDCVPRVRRAARPWGGASTTSRRSAEAPPSRTSASPSWTLPARSASARPIWTSCAKTLRTCTPACCWMPPRAETATSRQRGGSSSWRPRCATRLASVQGSWRSRPSLSRSIATLLRAWPPWPRT